MKLKIAIKLTAKKIICNYGVYIHSLFPSAMSSMDNLSQCCMSQTMHMLGQFGWSILYIKTDKQRKSAFNIIND